MMPEPSHQHDHFIQALQDVDVPAIVNALSSDVFDLNFRDVTHDLETPLMRLCHSGVTDEDMDAILQAADEKTPDVNLQDAVGRTLAMHACIALRHQIVVFSLAKGYDASKCDRIGKSAYHYAAESGSDWIMATLLKQPDALTYLKVLDFKGYSPTDIARHRKAHSVVKMISQAMSGIEKDSNPRPLNPKPLQPAFMRSTNLNQSPSKKQVTFDTPLGSNNNNNRLIPAFNRNPNGNGSNPPYKHGGGLTNSDRWEDNLSNKGNDSDVINDNDTNDDDDDDDNYDDDGDDNGSINDNNNNNHENSSNEKLHTNNTDLSPLRNTSCKQNADKLEHFTSAAPMGLIKPRPLPRLLTTNQNKDVSPRDRPQDFNFNNDEDNIGSPQPTTTPTTITSRFDNTSAATGTSNNNNNTTTPEPIQNDFPRKQTNSKGNTNNKNIFTLRPPPPPGNLPPTNRAAPHSPHSPRLLPKDKEAFPRTTNSPQPSTELKSPSKRSSKETCNSPRITSRNKISLDLSLGGGGITPTSNSNDPNKISTSPRQLGPVVSPRKIPYNKTGRMAVDDLLNNSTSQYNHLKTKFTTPRESENETETETGSGNIGTNQESSKLGDNKSRNSSNSDTYNSNCSNNPLLDSDVSSTERSNNLVQTTDRERSKTARRQHLPCRISAAGRRDLEAILSPVPVHRALLQKRKPTDSIKSQSDSIRNSYAIKINSSTGTTKHTSSSEGREDSNLFEEEIFLNADNGTIKLGAKKTDEIMNNDKTSRTGSRMTIRRSSLSLPDLRDMTGFLVMAQKKNSNMGGAEKLEAVGSGNNNNNKNKDGKNRRKDKNDDGDEDDDKYYNDYEADDDEDDNAEMDGDKSDDNDDDNDDVNSDLEDDPKPRMAPSPRHKGNNNATNKRMLNNSHSSKGGNNEKALPSILITNDSKSSFPSKTRGMAVPWS